MAMLFLILLSFSACAGVSQTGLLSAQSVSGQAYGTPLFSDETAYNEYDFCGSPLGIFEKESSTVHLELSFRMFSLANSSSADSGAKSVFVPVIPNLTVGKRNILYIMLDYEPAWVEHKDISQTLSLSPLHRFGLAVAAETPQKYLRFGITGKGYFGTLGTSLSNNDRTVMGLTQLSAYLGSQVIPLVRIGVHGGATGNLDSLEDKSNTSQDRFFYGTIPSWGGDINFGMDGFPVTSAASVTSCTNHFVYVTKGNFNQKPGGNEDALVGDSLAWQWETMGKIGYAGFVYQPAISMEYWRNKIQDYTPGEKNYPLQYGAARADTNWTFTSFSLGFGASSLLQEYGKAWLEYAHEFFWASYGAKAGAAGMSRDVSRGYDRIGLGLEGNIKVIPGLHMPKSMEAFLRMGFCNMRENSRFGQYHADEFRQINQVAPQSQLSGETSPYSLSFGGDERVSRFSLGAGATFFNRMLGLDFVLALLSRDADTKENGFEFGIGAEYMLKAWKEK